MHSTLKGDLNAAADLTQTAACGVPEERRRVVAPRGKSMEELGVSKVIRPVCLSRSSEQLDQFRGSGRMHNSTNPSFYQSTEKRSVAVSGGVSGGVQPGQWTPRGTGHQEDGVCG